MPIFFLLRSCVEISGEVTVLSVPWAVCEVDESDVLYTGGEVSIRGEGRDGVGLAPTTLTSAKRSYDLSVLPLSSPSSHKNALLYIHTFPFHPAKSTLETQKEGGAEVETTHQS